MEDEKKETVPEEEEDGDCTPLTDEEFREFQEKEAKTEKRIKGIFSAIWDAIDFFT